MYRPKSSLPRLLLALALAIGVAPRIAHAQPTLDVYLPFSDAQDPLTWSQAVPAHFSWWDPAGPGPSAVDCKYTGGGPFTFPIDPNLGVNTLFCSAGVNAGGYFRLVQLLDFIEFDTRAWLGWLTLAPATNPPLNAPPFWPNKIHYDLTDNVYAAAKFDGNSTAVQFMTLYTFQTEDAQHNRIMNYQFADPVLLPEPSSMALMASALLVFAAFATRRRSHR